TQSTTRHAHLQTAPRNRRPDGTTPRRPRPRTSQNTNPVQTPNPAPRGPNPPSRTQTPRPPERRQSDDLIRRERERAAGFGDLAAAREVDRARIGGAAAISKRGRCLQADSRQFVIVDQAVGADPVVADGESPSGEVERSGSGPPRRL